MRDRPIMWGLFWAYMIGTSYLAWLGHKKTDSIESFAVGKGDMPPWVVGITLAASVASAATFVLNPGLVYVHGMSALLHLGVAGGLGVIIGLFALSFGFRRVGAKVRAITLPQWVGQRYGSRALALFFALVNLLSVTFMVLIVGGLGIVMEFTLGLTYNEGVILIVAFVFGYIFVGGTYAHAYTNTLQGIIMTFVALWIVSSGIPLLSDGIGPFADRIAAQDPNLLKSLNPASPLYGSMLTVWISGFIIGIALVCQPHILTKALYVKTDREVMRYLLVSTAVSIAFTALLLVGLFARAADIPPSAFLDPATGLAKADNVVSIYINAMFGDVSRAFIAVALLSAGMSTLDGILVALSTITANDLFLNATERNILAKYSPQQRSKIAHRAGQVILVLLGATTLIISLKRPPLLSLFGQFGVFALVTASAVPILFGVFSKRLGAAGAMASSVVGLAVYGALFQWSTSAAQAKVDLREFVNTEMSSLAWLFDMSMPQLGFYNPAVLATYGIVASFLVAFGFMAIAPTKAPAEQA
jgi:SSS family solute:Na+ symporter/sodium/pantothenate symporter